MRKEFRLPFKLRALVIKSDRSISFNVYYESKYGELYIDFFKYLIVIFRDAVK